MNNNQQGFSLYELVAVLIIIGVALGVSLPLIANQILRRDNEAIYLQLKAAIKFAQSEAIRMNSAINICAAQFDTDSNGNNSYLSNNACTNSSWAEGVLAYADLDGDSAYDSGERVRALRFDYAATITAADSNSSSLSQFLFESNGQISTANTPFTFTITQSKFGITYTRNVCLNNYGYVCIKNEGDSSACSSTGDSTCSE